MCLKYFFLVIFFASILSHTSLCAAQEISVPILITDASNTPPKCYPACREGFICHQSACLSACNPPCESGFTCDSSSQCVSESPSKIERRQQLQILKLQIRKERYQLRMRYRKIPRITFYPKTFFAQNREGYLYLMGVAAGVGFRQNIGRFFGLYGRLGGLLAAIGDLSKNVDNSTNSRQLTSAVGFEVEFVPFLGPLGRFCIGPILWYHALFASNSSIKDNVENVVSPPDDQRVIGTGIDVGMVLGSREFIYLHGRIKTNFTSSWPVSFELAISFEFPTSKVD